MSRNPAAPRALIVKADPETARNLSLLLSQWEYQTKWATSSWQALEMINQWRPDVALIDAGLPVTNGNWPRSCGVALALTKSSY